VDGQLSAPLDALSDTSTSTTETIPVSCANATDFFNSLLGSSCKREPPTLLGFLVPMQFRTENRYAIFLGLL
jgi:hypothetical protein